MIDMQPFGFEVNRDNDGEKLKVLYSRQNDKFFQLQESLSECSTFIDDQVMKGKQAIPTWLKSKLTQNNCACLSYIETQVFIVTQLDPMFVMLPALLSTRRQQ